MKLSLKVVSQGKSEGKLIPITLSQFLVGRDPQCHLRPASAAISKRHCALLVRGGKAFVRDFDSTNGTFVNDEAVKGERELKNEDVLKIGPLTFNVLLEATPVAPSKPTPPPPAAKPAPAPAEPSDDESVAAMLLALQDEPSGSPVDGEGVPTGSTVMDVMPTNETATNEPQNPAGGKPAPNKANTSSAAKAILEKYMRRPRS